MILKGTLVLGGLNSGKTIFTNRYLEHFSINEIYRVRDYNLDNVPLQTKILVFEDVHTKEAIRLGIQVLNIGLTSLDGNHIINPEIIITSPNLTLEDLKPLRDDINQVFQIINPVRL